jgi:MFS family permease
MTTAQTASPTGLKPQTYMAVVATVAAIAGGLYGYDTGIISGALPQIANEFQLDYRAQEMVTAAILLGAVIGAICCTRLSASKGRRTTIMIVAAIYCVGVIAAALSPNAWCLAARRRSCPPTLPNWHRRRNAGGW